MSNNVINLTDREHATVIAALRHFQNDLNEDQRKEAYPEHFCLNLPLNNQEIDSLCERINLS